MIRGVKVENGHTAPAANLPVPSRELNGPDGNVTIFRNLGPDRTTWGFLNGVPVGGNGVPLLPEVSQALPFMPRADVHAITLAAAIGYVSGTKKVNLGVYADNDGTPGSLLPDGQGSTSDIPGLGDPGQLAEVTLPGAGVALTAGTQYWLVASPDDVNAPDFEGRWQSTDLALSAYQEPEHFINWTSFDAVWLAAVIRGTLP